MKIDTAATEGRIRHILEHRPALLADLPPLLGKVPRNISDTRTIVVWCISKEFSKFGGQTRLRCYADVWRTFSESRSGVLLVAVW
jgi:hypothetical protein